MTRRFLQFTFALANLTPLIAQQAQTETRVFQLGNTTTEEARKELIRALHVVTGVVSQETVGNSSEAFTVYGSPEQLTEAAWIVKELDSPPSGAAGPRQFAAATGDVLSITYLDPATKPQGMQEVMTTLRQVADMNRLFNYMPREAIILKAPPEQTEMAEWLISHLVKSESSTTAEYTSPGKSDDVTRVFHWNHSLTNADVQHLIRDVRIEAQVTHVFYYGAVNALAVRGTAAQLSKVDWLVKVTEPAH